MAAAAEQPVIFHDVESTIDNGFIGDVDSSLPLDSPPAAANTPHWLKKNVLPISLAFLALSAVVFASVVFRPGGPGNPNNIQSNLAAATRGAEVNGPSYMPTYLPTGPTPPKPEPLPVPVPVVETPFPTEPKTGSPTLSPTLSPTIGTTEINTGIGSIGDTVSTETSGPPPTANVDRPPVV